MTGQDNLLFIISQPRSGSTLTQKLVSNNDWVDTVSEPWLLLPYLSVFREDLINASYVTRVAKKGILDYLKKKNLEESYWENLRQFMLNLYPISEGKKYFIDKTPRYYEILPEIIKTFPEAKFLILKRNPFSTLYSMLHTWSDLKTDEKSISTFYRDFLVAPFKIHAFAESNINSDNFLVVKYEDIVLNTSQSVQQIYSWMNIPFTENVLNIASNEKVKGIFGDDVYNRKKSEVVSSDSLNEWEIIFDQKVLRNFFYEYQSFLGKEFIVKYGYDPLPDIKKLIPPSDSALKKFIRTHNLKQE